jgi:hypothetical protein
MLFKTRYNILPAVILLYGFPLVVFGYYIASNFPELSWKAFSSGMLLLALGSLGLFFLLRYWESQMFMNYFDEEPSESHGTLVQEEKYIQLQQNLQEAELRVQQKETENLATTRIYEQLQSELQAESRALQTVQNERDQLQIQLDTLSDELTQLKESTEEKLEQNQIFFNEHQHTINEQRHVIEAKQQHVQQLEDKVRDLTYEIKTLLHLAEKTQINDLPTYSTRSENSSKINLGENSLISSNGSDQPLEGESEASHQLRRCLDIAQKMTGASHYNRQAKKTELSVEHYAIDLRCLFESLRSENSFAILVYSQKENKLIFGNNQIKSLLGWSSEKFIQSFPTIIEDSVEVWNNCLTQLAYKNECQAELNLKSKNGAAVPVKCLLGVIPTGIFRSNILGILCKSDHS